MRLQMPCLSSGVSSLWTFPKYIKMVVTGENKTGTMYSKKAIYTLVGGKHE